MLKREDLLTTDLVYWYPTKPTYYKTFAWYDWDGPEYRECEHKNEQKDLRIFCCIKDGIFHYVE